MAARIAKSCLSMPLVYQLRRREAPSRAGPPRKKLLPLYLVSQRYGSKTPKRPISPPGSSSGGWIRSSGFQPPQTNRTDLKQHYRMFVMRMCNHGAVLSSRWHVMAKLSCKPRRVLGDDKGISIDDGFYHVEISYPSIASISSTHSNQTHLFLESHLIFSTSPRHHKPIYCTQTTHPSDESRHFRFPSPHINHT